jgi:hypothetical protein
VSFIKTPLTKVASGGSIFGCHKPYKWVNFALPQPEELRILELVQGKYLKYRLDQLTEQGNDDLLRECRERSGDKSMDDVGASAFILREIWKQLRETHQLRVIK